MDVTLGFVGVEVGAGTDDAVPTVSEGPVGLVLLLPLTGTCKWLAFTRLCCVPWLQPQSQHTKELLQEVPQNPTPTLYCGLLPNAQSLLPLYPLLLLPG